MKVRENAYETYCDRLLRTMMTYKDTYSYLECNIQNLYVGISLALERHVIYLKKLKLLFIHFLFIIKNYKQHQINADYIDFFRLF